MPEPRGGLLRADRSHTSRTDLLAKLEKPAPRQQVRYACPKGCDFTVPFLAEDDVIVPKTVECRRHGVEAAINDGTERKKKEEKPQRTHWVMLLERRSIEELEELLNQALAARRCARRSAR